MSFIQVKFGKCFQGPEGIGDQLGKAQSTEQISQIFFLCLLFAFLSQEGNPVGMGFRDVIIAGDSGDLFDQVGFYSQVRPERGRSHLKAAGFLPGFFDQASHKPKSGLALPGGKILAQ